METVNIIRASAGCPEIILSMIVDPKDTTIIKLAENKFTELARAAGIPNSDFSEILDDGYFDEGDGDTVSIHWAKITNPFKAQIGDTVHAFEGNLCPEDHRQDFEGLVAGHRVEHDGKIITTVVDADDDAFDLYDEEFELVEE